MQKELTMEFDDKMKQLNDICGKIQDSSCTVADSIKMYEQAANIALECLKQLEETRGKITIIKKQLDNYKEENFDVE